MYIRESEEQFTSKNEGTDFFVHKESAQDISSNEQQEKKEEKLRRWSKIELDVDKITDRLGEPIDKNIKETVTALIANDFKTFSSCEGHFDRAKPFPQVDIGESPPYEFLEKAAVLEVDDFTRLLENNPEVVNLIERNYESAERLRWILEEFYTSKQNVEERALILWPGGERNFGIGTLKPKEEAFTKYEDISEEEKSELLKKGREEMHRFTEFLRDRYFDSKTERREHEYKELLGDMDELRSAVHTIMQEEVQERMRVNPTPTHEELMVGAFKEELEPQVRDAIFEFFKKGYTTESSGFGGGGRQEIDGFFDIDDKTKKALREMDVSTLNGLELGFIGYGRKWHSITFYPKKADISEMKHVWDAVASLLPPQEKPASPSGSVGSYEFRRAHGGSEGLNIVIKQIIFSEHIQGWVPASREQIERDLKRGGWALIDELSDRSPKSMGEYSEIVGEFFADKKSE